MEKDENQEASAPLNPSGGLPPPSYPESTLGPQNIGGYPQLQVQGPPPGFSNQGTKALWYIV